MEIEIRVEEKNETKEWSLKRNGRKENTRTEMKRMIEKSETNGQDRN